MSSLIGVAALFVLVAGILFAVGFYFFQKRFWSQDRNASRTAPPSTPEGVHNKLHEDDRDWRPPRAS